jgi:hypothetical protein
LEPSVAAVMIAGIPIAIVASAIARASIMTIPLEIGELPERLISSLRNRFRDQIYRASASGGFRRIAFCFAACGNNRARVSRFVAIIGPTFRGLWRNRAVPNSPIICSTPDRPLGRVRAVRRLYRMAFVCGSCGSRTSFEVRYKIANDFTGVG